MTRWLRWSVHLRRPIRRAYRWVRLHVPRRVWLAFVITAWLLSIGTVGYRWIEGEPWTYFDGFYMTAITLTTIGYGEVHQLSTAGRTFTVVDPGGWEAPARATPQARGRHEQPGSGRRRSRGA